MRRQMRFVTIVVRGQHLILLLVALLLIEGLALGVLERGPLIAPFTDAVATTSPQAPGSATPVLAPPPQPAADAARLKLAKVGELAPDFTLPTLSGQTASLSQHAGKPVVIYFWATWCAHCVASLGEVTKRVAERAGTGATLLAVNLMEKQDTVRTFLTKHSFTLNTLLDTEGVVAQQYGIVATPTAYFIDTKGVVRARLVGHDPNRFMAHFATILPAPPPAESVFGRIFRRFFHTPVWSDSP